MSELTIRPYRSFATLFAAAAAVVFVVAAALDGSGWYVALSLGVLVAAIYSWNKRVVLELDGDQVTVRWPGRLPRRSPVTFARSAVLGVFAEKVDRLHSLVITTQDGDVPLTAWREAGEHAAIDARAEEIRAFLALAQPRAATMNLR